MACWKQVYNLTLEDFAEHAVWKFVNGEEDEEGQDEATVRPFITSGPLAPTSGMFVIKAEFRLADGTLMQGYVTPPALGDSSLGIIHPIVITDQGQVGFWYGMRVPTDVLLVEKYSRLGKDARSTFPMTFKSTIPLIGGDVSGNIPGFLAYEHGRIGGRVIVHS